MEEVEAQSDERMQVMEHIMPGLKYLAASTEPDSWLLVLSATRSLSRFDATRVTRLRFCLAQPSPAWAEHGLRRLKFYTARVATPTAWATLRPEPSLAAEEAEHADQLARGAGRLRQQSKVAAGVSDVLFHDQLVPCVDGDLRVVADADLGVHRHAASIRIGQRLLALAAGHKLGQHR